VDRAFEGLPVEPLNSEYNPIGPGDILLFATVRNEEVRLPAFLDYYRKLGVGRFFIVDNESTDGTRALLIATEDVVPFHTAASFLKANCGRDWTDALRGRFGRGHWCLTVDADELLCFPAIEMLTLHDLTQYCDRHGYEGLFTLMLDMYPAGPLRDAPYTPGEPLIEAFPFFDASGYSAASGVKFPPISVNGGMRRRVFGDKASDKVFAVLRKTPLIRWREGISYTHVTHSHSPIRLADITGVLLHFKFLSNFAEFVTAEVARGDRPGAALAYTRYAEAVSEQPNLALADENSRHFEDSRQLVELGLMKSSLQFLNDFYPALWARIGLRPAAEFRGEHKTALLTAARRFRPDLRQVLQIWEAISDPPRD